jgi:hypothetical protein
MSALTEPHNVNLKDLGWTLRRADDEEQPGVPTAERGWVYENAEADLKTPPLPKPGAAMSAARKLQEARESGQFAEGGAREEDGPGVTEATAEAPATSVDTTEGSGDAAYVSGDAPFVGDVRPLYHEFKAGPDGGCCFFGCMAEAGDPIHGEPPDDQADEGQEQPDGFPNPGDDFARGLGQGSFVSEASFAGRPALFAGAPAPLMQQMHPSRIRTHPSTLMRAGGLNMEHVEDLASALLSGHPLPPVDVFFDGTDHWLGDGNHRHAAALSADRALDVTVHKGSLRDAILFAVRSNASHGLKRTNDDKRLAVVTLLADEEWGRQSDTSVAGLADVTQPFVGKVQQWLVKLLPVLSGDGVEDPSDVPDEEFAERAGVPAGLVGCVRSLTDAQLETLSHNVMARAESRTASDGKRFNVERPAAEEPPPLFTGEEAPTPAGEELAQEPPVEAQEAAGEAAKVPDEDSLSPAPVEATQGGDERPEVRVNDRRTFAGEVPATAVTSPATPPAGTADSSQPAPRQQQPPTPTFEPRKKAAFIDALGNRPLAVSFAWMPGVRGKVNVTVNVGAKPATDARRVLMVEEKLMPFPEAVHDLIMEELGKAITESNLAAKDATTKKPAAGPSSKKAGGSKKGAAKRATKKAAKKGAAKSVKKGGSKKR